MADRKTPIKPGSGSEPAGSSSQASGADEPSDDENAIVAGKSDGNAVDVPASKSGERNGGDASAKPSAPAAQEKRKRTAKGQDRLVGNLDKAVLLLAKAAAFGLVAGAVGVLAAIVLRQYDDSSSEVPAKLAELSERLGALEAEVAAVDEAAAAATQAVASGLDEARTEFEAINSARTQAETSLESMSAGIEDRLAKLESAAQADGAASSGISERLASLDEKVAALEARFAAPSTNLAEGGIPDGADAALRAGAGTAPSSGISGLRQRVAALESASSDGSQDKISQRLDGLDSRISALEDLPADESTKAALDALVELESLSRQVETLREELASGEELTPRALALIGVRAAAATGAPFKSLLDDAGVGDEELPDVLREHGETGIATMADLRESFPEAARAAQRAANAGADTGGIVDGFLGLFQSAVQVRPLEPVEGDDVPALLSRAESMVRGNRLAEAMDLLAALPESGMAAMAGWLQSARARLDVLAAIDGLLNESGEG